MMILTKTFEKILIWTLENIWEKEKPNILRKMPILETLYNLWDN